MNLVSHSYIRQAAFDRVSTFQCYSNIFVNTGAHPCELKPFQLVPYSHNDPPTKFTVDVNGVEMLLHCSVLNGTTRNKKARPQVKYPRYSKEMELNWMEKSYINFTVSKKDFFFKVCYYNALFFYDHIAALLL